MPVDSGVQVRSRSAPSWPSEDDWSDEDERHDDSDTIVISSRSRILISPRKKGTKAVSRLLGASTAENVVQMLSGTQDVMQKLQSSQVRVHKSRKHEGSERKQNNTSAQPIQNDKRTASSTGAAKATTRSRVETLLESEESDGEFQFESGSDVDLSSEDGQDQEEDMPQRAPSQSARTKTPSPVGVAAAQPREKQPSRPRSIRAATYDSGDDYNDEMSDGNATAVTHASSRDSKSKFDDHLQVSNEDTRSSTKSVTQTKRSKHRKASNSFMDQSSIDMNNSIILPTPTQEMEDLKQTLKNLASQDTTSSGDFEKQRSTKSTKAMSSAYAQQHQSARMTARQREQIIAAPVMQLSTESDAWSLGEAVSKLDGSKKNRSMIVRSEDDDSGDDHNASSTGSISSTPEVARRLFTTPPPRQKAVSRTPSTVPLTGASHRNSPSSFHSSPAYKNSFNQNTPSPSTSALRPSPGALPPSNAQGSRAVLSALKALQDKIRRLEEEREKLLQELSDVKVKARKREAEFASAEKKLTYELGQSKESARAAYDALRSEKEELKLELVKYAERRKAMQAELQHAQKLVSTYSAKSEDLQSQVHLCESQEKGLHKEMDAMHAAHKQEVQDLNGQVITLQMEADASHEQVKLLESQFDRESNNHAETRERLRDAESHIMEDLEAAVMAAEKEFEDLNKKYKAASAKVESGGPGAAQASSQLGAMLDELEAKGKQLNLLKQVYEQAANSTINPIRHVVHSPEAIRRKTASLRILNEYRQLEREAKSPRHELSDGAGTPRASRHASFFSDHD
ncbi:hypothetical protein Poli38472_002533 [Pythium oligandrum]|uniref:Uncharacterized protein n=1 Tax=Pythium oligandrum TaxID=41045 RepID=A0A8K1CHP6_PYTOL|nr:hypothetical protein Poli38472_002533 [Pythium oligandrum]|eukprot:TMW63592.1 hypothetical protein Poli38472_002533 [Pythium oligandrum]